jgi:hypothetical protein
MTLGIGAPEAIRKSSDVMDRLDKMAEEILPAVQGGAKALNDKNITKVLRESLLIQMTELIP